MSDDKVTAVKCEGPCGKVKLLTEFLEYRPGARRRRCKTCFNERRKGRTHGGVKEGGKPIIRQERLEAVVEHRLKSENRELREKNAALAEELASSSEYKEIIKAMPASMLM